MSAVSPPSQPCPVLLRQPIACLQSVSIFLMQDLPGEGVLEEGRDAPRDTHGEHNRSLAVSLSLFVRVRVLAYLSVLSVYFPLYIRVYVTPNKNPGTYFYFENLWLVCTQCEEWMNNCFFILLYKEIDVTGMFLNGSLKKKKRKKKRERERQRERQRKTKRERERERERER